MRLKVILSPVSDACYIPFNYQYSLSSAIYELIRFADESYASELHDYGLKSTDGKSLKLFTFSYLFTPRKEIVKNKILIKNHNLCYFYMSSPLINSFVKNIVIGLFGRQELNIHNERFQIIKVDPISSPKFTNEERFKCLSPFVISSKQEYQGSLKTHYFRPEENGLSEAIKNNLIRKYLTLYNKMPNDSDFEFSLDESYIKYNAPNKLTKMITIKEGQDNNETKIKCIFAPFKLAGNTELMKIAWEAGLGAHCSQGFGCIDIIK